MDNNIKLRYGCLSLVFLFTMICMFQAYSMPSYAVTNDKYLHTAESYLNDYPEKVGSWSYVTCIPATRSWDPPYEWQFDFYLSNVPMTFARDGSTSYVYVNTVDSSNYELLGINYDGGHTSGGVRDYASRMNADFYYTPPGYGYDLSAISTTATEFTLDGTVNSTLSYDEPTLTVTQVFNALDFTLSGHGDGLVYAELDIYQLDANMVGYTEATQEEILLGTYDTVNSWSYPLAFDLANDPDTFSFTASDGWDYTQEYRAEIRIYDAEDTLYYTKYYYPATQDIQYDPTQTNETIFDGWYVKYGLTGFTIQSQVMTFDNSYIKVKDSAGNVVSTSIEYDFVRNTDVVVPYGFSPVEGQTYYLNIIQSRLGPDIPILVDYEFTYGVTDSTVNTGQDLDVYQENQDTLNDMIEKAEDGLQSMYDLARGGLLLYGLMFAWLPYPLNQYGMILGVLVAVSFIIKWLLGRG